MELIHTCYRIGDIDRSVAFYEALGFEERRRMPIRDEAINVFMGLPGDGDRLELTYNHGVDSYELGTGYNHIAVTVDDFDRVLPALAEEVEKYRDLTSFPSLRQDIAVVVADDVPAQRVVDVVRAAGAPVLAGAEVFDVYRGAQLGEGRVSLALHLEFRAADRTLTDEDVAPVRERVVAALREQVAGELRG